MATNGAGRLRVVVVVRLSAIAIQVIIATLAVATRVQHTLNA